MADYPSTPASRGLQQRLKDVRGNDDSWWAATKSYASRFMFATIFFCLLLVLGGVQLIAFLGTLFGTGDVKRAGRELID